MLIVSYDAEKDEVRTRRPLGDPWLAEATPEEMRQAIMDNMARNLSRLPEKQLGVDFLAKSVRDRDSGMDAQQAAWTNPTPQQTHTQDHPTVVDLKTAIAHSPIKLLPGPEEIRRETRSMRPAAERPKTPRPTPSQADVHAEFADALRREGFQLRGAPIMDGKWHREKVESDKGHTKSGRYKAYTDGLPAGFIQNFKRGEEINWRSDRPAQTITEADLARIAADRAAREHEQAADLQAAATRAQSRWDGGRPLEKIIPIWRLRGSHRMPRSGLTVTAT